jgi:hypothetical protein
VSPTKKAEIKEEEVKIPLKQSKKEKSEKVEKEQRPADPAKMPDYDERRAVKLVKHEVETSLRTKQQPVADKQLWKELQTSKDEFVAEEKSPSVTYTGHLMHIAFGDQLVYDLGTGEQSYTMAQYINMKKSGQNKELVERLKGLMKRSFEPILIEPLSVKKYILRDVMAPFKDFDTVKTIKLPVMHETAISSLGVTVKLIADVTSQQITLSPNLPLYKPSYTSIGFDNSFKTYVQNSRNVELIAEMKYIMENYYFGAYGPEGQAKRFGDVTKIHHQFLKAVKANPDLFYGKYHSHKEMSVYHQYLRDISSRFGAADELIPLTIGLPFMFKRTTSPRLMQERWEEIWKEKGQPVPFPLIYLNPDSNAGPLYPESKHREVALDEFMNSGIMMRMIEKEGIASYPALLTMKLTQMKPKNEVYERPTEGKGPTKVRNIFATNMSAFIPAQIILTLAYSRAPRFWEHTTSRSMYGWSPFKGGMTTFMYFCMSRKLEDGSLDVLLYSDNLYIILRRGTLRSVISLDGAKLEACHDSGTVRRTAARWMRACKFNSETTSEPNEVTSTWVRYMLDLFPEFAGNAAALIGTKQLQVPGLASGSLGTMQLNHELMANVADTIKRKALDRSFFSVDDDKLLQKFNDAASMWGVTLTMENITTFPDDPTASFQYFAEREGDVIRMDVLGFDAYVRVIDDKLYFSPALTRKRLMQSLVFHKFIAYNEYSETMVDVLKAVIYKVMYAIGGYAHKDIGEVLQNLVHTQGAAVKNTVITGSKEMETLRQLGLDVMLEQQLLSTVADMDILNVEQLDRLHLGEAGFIWKLGIFNINTLENILTRNFGLFEKIEAGSFGGVPFADLPKQGIPNEYQDEDLIAICSAISLAAFGDIRLPCTKVGAKWKFQPEPEFTVGLGSLSKLGSGIPLSFHVLRVVDDKDSESEVKRPVVIHVDTKAPVAQPMKEFMSQERLTLGITDFKDACSILKDLGGLQQDNIDDEISEESIVSNLKAVLGLMPNALRKHEPMLKYNDYETRLIIRSQKGNVPFEFYVYLEAREPVPIFKFTNIPGKATPKVSVALIPQSQFTPGLLSLSFDMGDQVGSFSIG